MGSLWGDVFRFLVLWLILAIPLFGLLIMVIRAGEEPRNIHPWDGNGDRHGPD